MKKFLLLFFIIFLVGIVNAQTEGESCNYIGQIQDNFYCGVNYKLHQQKTTGLCSNNFECVSDFCLENECQAGGSVEEVIRQHNIIQDILSWMKGEGWAGLGDPCTKDLDCEDPYNCDPTTNRCIEIPTAYVNGRIGDGGKPYTATTRGEFIGGGITPKYIQPPSPGEPIYQAFCGNGYIDLGENCENCIQDVPCGPKEVCKNKVCKKKFPLWWLWIVIPLALIIGLVAYLKLRKR